MDGKRIQKITAEGLTYLDDDGKEQFIDFEACYQSHFTNFMKPENLQRFKEINSLNDEKLQESIERHRAWKEVGIRQVLGQPWDDGPYLELHTDPPIRFKFATKEDYSFVVGSIHKLGW